MNPIVTTHTQNTAADTWTIDASDFIPFGGRIRVLQSAVPEGALTTAGNSTRYLAPYALVGTGSGGRQAQLRWSEDVKGKVTVNMRMDQPA
jgi:hypothetical protein